MTDSWVNAGRIRQNLVTIRNVWGATISVIHRQMSDEPVTGSAVSPALIPTYILDARADCLRDIRLHAGIIRENVGGKTTHLDTTVLDQVARFVDTWALLYAEQMPDDAATCAGQVERHARVLKGMVRGDQLHRYQVGRCPELVDVAAEFVFGHVEAQTRCPGNLWASMRRQDTMLPQSIVCDQDPGHAWAPWQWAALGKRLEVPA